MMTSFWSGWVMFLVTFNFVTIFFLFAWAPKVIIPTDADGTTGHTWSHGWIREGLHRLPTWWILFSFAMFVSAFVYLVRYPGFGNTKGTLDWTSHQEVTLDAEANRGRMAVLTSRLTALGVEALAADAQATSLGRRIFVDNCAACHGHEAHGNPLLGAPNLTDGDWLYGGDGDTIVASITNGRQGVMPPLGTTFDETAIANLANYVLSLSGAPHSAEAAEAGKPNFAVCSACHGIDGKGNKALGAPNLTDSIWLYGGDLATIEKTIHDGRSGMMPAWGHRLSASDIKAVAAWVYAQSHPAAGNGATN